MSEVIQCNSCGSANQLPDGRNSMFCAFCGSAIEKKAIITENKNTNKENNLLSKPQIDYDENKLLELDYLIDSKLGTLSLKSKEITSIKEITDWFTDKELENIGYLNLENNNISDLSRLELFGNLRGIDLSKNNLDKFEYENLPSNLAVIRLENNNIKHVPISFINSRASSVIYMNNNPLDINSILDLENSDNTVLLKKLKDRNLEIYHDRLYGIDSIYKNMDNAIKKYPHDLEHYVNEYYNSIKEMYQFHFRLHTNIDLSKLISKNLKVEKNKSGISSTISRLNATLERSYFLNSIKSNVLFAVGINNLENEDKARATAEKIFDRLIGKTNNQTSNNQSTKEGGKCFIATATMGSYNHPEVMELRQFRDNWILRQNWGENFVKWYYHYGEKLAKIIEASNLLKKISYCLVVKPLVIISRIILK